ncbi:MAG TPA: hypothetical protein ENI52_01935 [Thermoplasmata archaeon]|nr:hypothetical protein [Thermoplasmata archaeon]
MKREIAIGIAFMLIIPVVTANNTNPSYFNRNGKTLYVGGDGPNNYTSIQDAINDANDGDTIFVCDDSSPYYENIIINKSIMLIGENKETTIINGGKRENTITVVNNSFICNFTIRESGDACAGIGIESEYTIIKENIITDNDYAIYISNKNYITIIGNIIYDNTLGLWVSNSHYNNISNNQFINDGLFIFNSYYNAIHNNTVNGNPLVYMEGKANREIADKTGQIILIRCNNITIRDQELSNTFFAIYLLYTNNSCIYQNNITNCKAGIILDKSNTNCIFHNNISRSEEEAIGLQFSNNNTITENNIFENYIGVVSHSSYFNTINFNNIMKNFFQALLLYIYKDSWPFYNCWNENYWGKPKILPKPIFGFRFPLIWISFDWHPLRQPYKWW